MVDIRRTYPPGRIFMNRGFLHESAERPFEHIVESRNIRGSSDFLRDRISRLFGLTEKVYYCRRDEKW